MPEIEVRYIQETENKLYGKSNPGWMLGEPVQVECECGGHSIWITPDGTVEMCLSCNRMYAAMLTVWEQIKKDVEGE